MNEQVNDGRAGNGEKMAAGLESYECWDICGHKVEYYDDIHSYLVDGVQVPSVTQVLKVRFGHKYTAIDPVLLNKARELGIKTHKAIEEYCRTGREIDLREVQSFILLKNQYNFEVLSNEVPVILFRDDKPIMAGRLDLVLKGSSANGMTMDPIGLADIKRTFNLDQDYLASQLNLYRIAYRQSYGVEIDFLKGIHLIEDIKEYVDIPIDEQLAWNIIDEYENKRGF